MIQYYWEYLGEFSTKTKIKSDPRKQVPVTVYKKVRIRPQYGSGPNPDLVPIRIWPQSRIRLYKNIPDRGRQFPSCRAAGHSSPASTSWPGSSDLSAWKKGYVKPCTQTCGWIQHFKWIRIRIQSGSRVLMTKSWGKKYSWNFIYFFDQKLQTRKFFEMVELDFSKMFIIAIWIPELTASWCSSVLKLSLHCAQAPIRIHNYLICIVFF